MSLKELRKSKGLTQAQLASMVGCTGQSISNIEVGKQKPRVRTLNSILDALKATDEEKTQVIANVYNNQ